MLSLNGNKNGFGSDAGSWNVIILKCFLFFCPYNKQQFLKDKSTFSVLSVNAAPLFLTVTVMKLFFCK